MGQNWDQVVFVGCGDDDGYVGIKQGVTRSAC